MKSSLRTKLVGLFVLLITFSVGLMSWRNFEVFKQDKETYVYDLISQVINVQSQQLAEQVDSTENLLDIFADFSDYKLGLQEKKRFLNNYRKFYFVGTFDAKLKDVFAIADKKKLARAGLSKTDIKKEPSLKAFLDSKESFQIVNLTKPGNTPVFGVYARPEKKRIVAAIIPVTSFFGEKSRAKAYTLFMTDAKGTVLFHEDKALQEAKPSVKDHPLYMTWQRNPGLSQTREFTMGEEAYLGGFSPIGNRQLGLFVSVSKNAAFSAAKRIIKDSAKWALIIFILSGLIGILFAYTITKPIKKLVAVTQEIAKGNFNVKMEKQSNDELGELVNSFNKMGEELDERDHKLEIANQSLIQGEKMSAFGQMSAGIAHEVKNPLAGILGYAQLSKRKVDSDSPIYKYVEIIEKETKRCKEIIENLMRFARQEESTFEPFHPNLAVSAALDLVDHQISLAGVKIQKDISEDDKLKEVIGSSNQIQQVLMNLMLNAQHAMEDGGNLIVKTSMPKDDQVEIRITDNGSGIEQKHLEKIFEPFFTTKEAGQGTGLGLAVSYGIIRDHKGMIRVESEVGVGTTFIITLPTKDSGRAPETRRAA